MRRERPVAVGMVLAAAGSLQVGAAFAVTLFDELGPGGAACLRLLLAAAVLWAIWRPRLAGDLRLAAAFGLALGLMNWSIYEAMARIPLGVAVSIEFAGPLLVAVLASRRPLDGVWVLLAAGGILILADPRGGSIDAAGVLLAVAAAACWMAYIHLGKRTGETFAGGGGLAIAMAVGALVVLPAGIAQGGAGLAAPDLLGAALVVALGVVRRTVFAGARGAAAAARRGVRRADVAPAGRGGARRLRRARAGARRGRAARHRHGRGRRRRGVGARPLASDPG